MNQSRKDSGSSPPKNDPGIPKKRMLFVCVANICRSPIAEACFKQFITENNIDNEWFVDSCGIADIMAGSPPDPRGKATMTRHKIYHHVATHRARMITQDDYDKFDFMMALDEPVMRELERRAPSRTFRAKIYLLGSFDDIKLNNGSIADPFASVDPDDFERVFEQCYRSCKNFLEQLY